MSTNKWFDTFPLEEGFYWFYGDPYQGQMGMDYKKDAPPIKYKIYFVEIHKISNGFMGKCEGQFFPKRKFDKEKGISGYIGYFKKVKFPTLPTIKISTDKTGLDVVKIMSRCYGGKCIDEG